jgi:hypothetical protein
VTKLSDFVSERQWRASPINLEYGGGGQIREMSVYFPDEPRHTMRLMLRRGPAGTSTSATGSCSPCCGHT